LTLMITAGFAFLGDSSSHCGVLSVAAQASPAKATVTNNVTVSPASITLGSTLQATGTVTTGENPLANASVALHMGDVKLADAQTNANGDYSFNVPVGLSYFPAAFWNGAMVYTVAAPQNASLTSAPSAVTTVAVNVLPLYLIIAVITCALLFGLYFYTQRVRGKKLFRSLGKLRAKPAAQERVKERAESPSSEARTLEEGPAVVPATPPGEKTAEKPPQETLEPALHTKSAESPVDESPREEATQPPESAPTEGAETGAIKQAQDFFEQGNDQQAVNMLYDAVILDVATTHEITIASHATHWEKYHTIEAAVPGIQEPLRALTVIYERANYAGKALTEEQRKAAVDAFRAITAQPKSANT
jgi:hypothetical protein